MTRPASAGMTINKKNTRTVQQEGLDQAGEEDEHREGGAEPGRITAASHLEGLTEQPDQAKNKVADVDRPVPSLVA